MNNVYDVAGATITVKNGEFTEDKNSNLKFYTAICTCNNNTILLAKKIKGNCNYDIVEDVLNNIYKEPLNYLANILNNYNNILVFVYRDTDNTSCYEIYYNYDNKQEQLGDIINWMSNNSDNDDDTHLYTEIKDGHKQCIKF